MVTEEGEAMRDAWGVFVSEYREGQVRMAEESVTWAYYGNNQRNGKNELINEGDL